MSSSRHKFWVVGVTVDLYEGGDFLSFSLIRDEEHVLDASGGLIAFPSGSRMYAWLWSSW